MATATVHDNAAVVSDHRHLNHLHAESLPLIDLGLLSQSELLSLSLCSSAASSLLRLQTDADVSTPKIDRSVFNESAGSRKQTFSRLRLAPPRSNNSSPLSIETLLGLQAAEQPLDEENSQIIDLLRSLFGADSHSGEKSADDYDNLVPVPIQYDENFAELQNSAFDIADCGARAAVKRSVQTAVADFSLKKRKRGRPRKNENRLYNYAINVCNNEAVDSNIKPIENVNAAKEDSEIKPIESVNVVKEETVLVNRNVGNVVDVVAWGSVEDPYGEELRRRTEGMGSEAELLGFLEGLEGEWGSSRKKRRILDAGLLVGGLLPGGWKLMICVKKRARHFWLTCSRYISPNGQQFVSFKEVSLYLLSFSGLQDATHTSFGHIDLTEKITSANNADFTFKDDKNGSGLGCSSALPVSSTELERQATSLKVGSPGEVPTGEKYKCHKCTMGFDEPDDLLQHLLLSHQRTPKRLRCGTPMNEEVIMKNGKYECQFCHKAFEEKHSYHGHLGNHIKDYVKRVGASGGGINIEKSFVPASVGASFNKLKTEESIGGDRDFVALAHNSEINSVTSFAIPYCEIKANASVETSSSKHDRVCSINNDIMENEFTNVVTLETNNSSGAESALLDNTNFTLFKPSDETNALKCTNNGISSPGRQDFSLTSIAAGDKVCIVKDNQSLVETSLIEDHNLEKGTESGILLPKAKEKTVIYDIVNDSVHSSSMEINKGGSSGKDEPMTAFLNSGIVHEDIMTNIKEQNNSFVPSGDDQRYCTVMKVTGALTSIVEDTKQKRDSKGGLPFSIGEELYVSKNNVNNVSTSTLSETNKAQSGNVELTIHFGRNYPVSVEEAATSNEERKSCGSCSVSPSCNEPMSLIEKNVKGIHKCMIMKSYQERDSENSQLALYGSEQFSGFKYDKVNVSDGRMGVPTEDVYSCSKNDFSRGSGFAVGRATNVELKRSNSFLLNPLENEQKFSLQDNGVCNSTVAKLTQDSDLGQCSHRPSVNEQTHYDENNMNGVSCITMEEHKHKQVKSISNGDPCSPFAHGHTKQDADVAISTMQESCFKDSSIDLSGYQFMLNTRDYLTDSYRSIIDELKQKNVCTEGSLSLSGSEQAQNVGDNLNWFSTGKLQDEPRLEHLGNSGKNELVIGFNNHNQANENSISEFMWRTDEENDLLSGFVDTSSRLQQSSGCFPTFNAVSNKGESELFGDKFGTTSGFEGLRSDSMENMEYDFLTTQMGSQPYESNINSYDAEMAQGFDSSVWPEKEALPLLPKIARKHHAPTICVWCRHEFCHEVESEVQEGSMGFTCAACKAKFSGQFNFL